MKKFTFLSILLAIIFNVSAQQIFKDAGFKISAPCKLYPNDHFIKEVQKQGAKVIGAYICTDDENDFYHASLVNVNIYDMTAEYNNFKPEQYSIFENSVLDSYAKSLSTAKISYKKITFMGVSALEYSFDQMGLPTKAIVFWKNKKSYLIQLGSRDNLATKFSALKNSFSIL